MVQCTKTNGVEYLLLFYDVVCLYNYTVCIRYVFKSDIKQTSVAHMLKIPFYSNSITRLSFKQHESLYSAYEYVWNLVHISVYGKKPSVLFCSVLYLHCISSALNSYTMWLYFRNVCKRTTYGSRHYTVTCGFW